MARRASHAQHRFIQRPRPADRFERQTMNTVDLRWLDVASSRSAALRTQIEPVLQRWLFALRAPVWQVLLGALCALGLLVAFYQVVHDGVQQSQLRHRAAAAMADGVWRCNAVRGASERANCQDRLNGAQRADTAPQDDRGAAAMAVVQLGR
jgi:hypothetical protein